MDASSFGVIDGGAGAGARGDILDVDASLDLQLIAGSQIRGIESISLVDSSFASPPENLTLDAGDVISIGSATYDPSGTEHGLADALWIDGDGNDRVTLTGGGWTQQGVNARLADSYCLWTHDAGDGTSDAYVLAGFAITVVAA
jgi:hypothetical protein